MRIDSLHVSGFKNIAAASLYFSPSINCVVGANGMGKSNLLESIYYLAMTRSFLRLPDAEVLMHGAPSMLLQGRLTLDTGASRLVSLGYERGGRKVLRTDSKPVARMSAHIGTLPLVLASPADSLLATGGPEERRRLMDMSVSQADPAYLPHLVQYSRALASRNALLKTGRPDPLLLDALEERMAASGAAVIKARREWSLDMAAPFATLYEAVAGEPEHPLIEYSPSRSETDLAESLRSCRGRDAAAGFTTAGPHRDDLRLLLGGRDLRRVGSQGQIKTFTTALRLALHRWMAERTGETPLLLLDDIFDKLDAGRVANILALVASHEGGVQTFITDTGREHIDSLLADTPAPFLLLEADRGSYRSLNSRP